MHLDKVGLGVVNRDTMATPVPWFHETPSPNLWNEWTWTHIAWGVVAYRLTGEYLMPLVAHTLYEVIESYVFPDPHRDVSMLNHIGDTLAFVGGLELGRYIETSNHGS